jgi:hypothetical protein
MQLLWTRLKLEGSFLPTFPRFRATLTLLLFLGIGALSYGHLWDKSPQNQNLSLTLSVIAWGGAFLIGLLQSPLKRIRTFLAQVFSIILAVLFVLAAMVCYQMFFVATQFPVSVQYAWLVGTVLLGYMTLRVLAEGFGRFINNNEGRFPGLITSPVLFTLLVVNYIWWLWPTISAWLQTL